MSIQACRCSAGWVRGCHSTQVSAECSDVGRETREEIMIQAAQCMPAKRCSLGVRVS
jgi:hypothetical protein